MEPPARGDPFDRVHNVPLGSDWFFDFGGSFRFRYEADENRTLGASAVDNETRLLFRTLLYTSFRYGKAFRGFVEVRYSDVWGNDRPKGAIFADDADFQNLFLEFTGGVRRRVSVTARLGRQELLFGAQRLVSPLDWSNTRRTFDGVTITVKSRRTEMVLFGTRPVAHEPHDLDSSNSATLFWGVHARFLPASGHRLESYLYGLDSREIFDAEDGTPGDLIRLTLGGRYLYTNESWRAELEAAYQDGNLSVDDISAWMASGTLGYAWPNAAWRPAIDFGLDVASGDADPDDGRAGTFDQLFPLAHFYLGHIDLVGRQNIEAARLGVALSPLRGLRWVTTLHRFELEQEKDALYFGGGLPLRRDPTGNSGTDVATEVDTTVTWSFKTHNQVNVGVVKWWSDDFIENTGSGRNAWFAWTAYEFRF